MSDQDAGIGFAVIANLGTAVEKLQAGFDDWVRQQNDYQRKGPQPVQFRGSCTAPSTGSGYISLGGPASSRMWIVRRLIVQGISWSTTAAGSCNVHVTTTETPVPGGLDIVDNSTALPNKAFYSGWQLVLINPQRLVVEIVGGTSGQTYAATGMGEDIPLFGVKVVASE
jgi:hypothetical protein